MLISIRYYTVVILNVINPLLVLIVFNNLAYWHGYHSKSFVGQTSAESQAFKVYGFPKV